MSYKYPEYFGENIKTKILRINRFFKYYINTKSLIKGTIDVYMLIIKRIVKDYTDPALT